MTQSVIKPIPCGFITDSVSNKTMWYCRYSSICFGIAALRASWTSTASYCSLRMVRHLPVLYSAYNNNTDNTDRMRMKVLLLMLVILFITPMPQK